MNEQENIENILQCPVCGLEFLDSDLMKHEVIHFVSPEDDYEAGFKAGRQDELAHLASLAPEDALLKDVEIYEYSHPYDYSELIDLKKLLKAQLAKVWPIAEARIERTKKLAEAEGYLKGQRAEREKVIREVGELVEQASVTGDTQVERFENMGALIKALKSGEAKSDLA